MDSIKRVEEIFPEIKRLNDVLDNSLDLSEKLDAIKAASDLKKKLFKEIETCQTIVSPDNCSVQDKLMAIMVITSLLIYQAGTTSERKLLKRHQQSVNRLKGIQENTEVKKRREEDRRQVKDKPVLLLSYYLVEIFVPVFETAGFEVLHKEHFPLKPSAREHVQKHFSDPDAASSERFDWHDQAVKQYIEWFMRRRIDAVIEWQHGREDYPLMEMYREVQGYIRGLLGNRYEEDVKTMPNFSNPPDFYLCLNWDGQAPENWKEQGYRGLLEADFDEDDLDEIYQQAMKRKLKK